MKRFMIHSVFAAAALAAVVTTVNAQTLTAEIPFAFRAGQTLMAPGTYEITADRGMATKVFVIRNGDTHKSILLPTYLRTDPPKAWTVDGRARLSFECVDARCSLHQIWTGDSPAYQFSGPKVARDGVLHLTEVPLTRTPSF